MPVLPNPNSRDSAGSASEGSGADHYAPFWIAEGTQRCITSEPLSHPAFDRLMARIPFELRRTFTGDQLAALSRASVVVRSPHSIDYRVSVPFFGKRFYLTILAGRERRSLARLAFEGQLLILKTRKVNATVLCFMLTLGLISFVILNYIVKSALGIDAFQGDSAMPDIYRILNERQGG